MQGNYTLSGLVGFDLRGKTVGVVGTGKIGLIAATILAQGFGCRVLGFDQYPNPGFTAIGGAAPRRGRTQGVCFLPGNCPGFSRWKLQ